MLKQMTSLSPIRSMLALLLAVPLMAQAQTTIYKCKTASGVDEFTDVKRSGCLVVDLGPQSAPRASTPIPAPRRATTPTPSSALALPSGSFPRVDAGQQRSRDEERRAILTEELNMELQKLATLRQQFNAGVPERQGDERNYARYQERVESMRAELARTERNIEALKREIGNLR